MSFTPTPRNAVIALDFKNSSGHFESGGPACLSKGPHFYLSWCISDALGENRLDAAASLTRELAARAGADIDIFNRTAEALAYHGQLSLLVEAFRIAWPSVRTSTNIMPWGVTSFTNMASDYEIFDYLERTSSPDPADPALLDRVTYFVKDPRRSTWLKSSMISRKSLDRSGE